jgi:hypothetical protein
MTERAGGAGSRAQIDHIRDDSRDLDNLELLCADCHHAKTARQMVPASAAQQAMTEVLYPKRVEPDVPSLLCDYEQQWLKQWQALKKARRQRLLDRIEEMGLDVDDFRAATRAEMMARSRTSWTRSPKASIRAASARMTTPAAGRIAISPTR